jgi:hypothetical protein
VTTARKANKCAGAVLITVCWDEAEAEKCRRVIRTGRPGFIFVPIVIDRRTVPDPAGGSPYLVLLTAIIGGIDLESDSGARTVIQAITGSGAGNADHRTLTDIILGIATDAARDRLEELMAISYRSEFIDSWIQKGEEKGKAEGKAEGEARAKAQAILKVLDARGLQPTSEQREQVTACADAGQLDTWFDRALTATSAAQVFQN